MNTTYKPFESIEEIKEKAEFRPAGSIYPVRIIKASKKRYQHKIIAGSNQYAFPTKKGYLIFSENNDGMFDCVVRGLCKNCGFQGSPYHEDGTLWLWNKGLDDEKFLDIFNIEYLRMNEA